jgi:UDP-2-acetamido-3-amino-2,3-dideoxy-glucuronate N-acetyltransferase
LNPDCIIGDGKKIWDFSHIMSGSTIGANCNPGQNEMVSPGVVPGKNVKVRNNVSIYTGATCEDDVFLGPSMVFTNVINPRSFVVRKDESKSTIVRKRASIGANATIVCGTGIGACSLVGTGAVIVKPVLTNALLAGNAARQIGWVSEAGHKLAFHSANKAWCEQEQQGYTLVNGRVSRV